MDSSKKSHRIDPTGNTRKFSVTKSSNTLWISVIAALLAAVVVYAFVSTHDSTKSTASSTETSMSESPSTSETPVPTAEIGDKVIDGGLEFMVASVGLVDAPAPPPAEGAPGEVPPPPAPADPSKPGEGTPPPAQLVEISMKVTNLTDAPIDFVPGDQILTDRIGTQLRPVPAPAIPVEPHQTIEPVLHYPASGPPAPPSAGGGSLEVHSGADGIGSVIMLTANRVGAPPAPEPAQADQAGPDVGPGPR